MENELGMWTIYDHPADYPTGYVLRRWELADGHPVPGVAMMCATLELARSLIPPHADYRLQRDPLDDPAVLETWI